KRDWNFADAGITTLVDASQVELTGTPVFLFDSQAEDPAEDAKRIEVDCTPNPFSSELTLDLNLPDPMLSTLRVYDMTGRQVTDLFTGEKLTEGEHSLKVSGDNLPAGTYYFQFRTAGGRQVGCQVVKK
ncbi:MAG: T9SS type A sorting domain-containing protein, partial [Bacteroidota bacterium]